MIGKPTFDDGLQRVLVRAEGTVTLDEIRVHLEEERAAGDLSFGELIDARGSTPAISSTDVRSVVAALRQLGASARLGPTAVIVDTDLEYGMLRMLGLLVEDVCAVRPFRVPEEAVRWLDSLRAPDP